MKKVISRILIFFALTLLMLVLCLYCVMWVCVNGPSKRAKELFIMSVRETSAVGFLADWFCTPEEIEQIELSKQAVVTDEVDTSLIVIDKKPTEDTDNQNKQVTDKKEDEKEKEPEEPIEIINVSGSTYKGLMMIVKDPSRVKVGTSSATYSSDVPGKRVEEMIENYGAIAGINAGGFDDPQGYGNGGIPLGIVISEGEFKYGNLDSSYELIGLNKDNVLIAGTMTARKALETGIRDAVSFGPILVLNGEATQASQGGGLNPRTAIGQRSDGAILLLVIDGRQSSSLGASYADLAEIMIEYGAVNAANLDGGSSSVMYYKGELLNSCASLSGPRKMPTCILVQ
ncbi:MAG: phosphodiester glycosidase family protein [Lachnospiraceae bacterium]